MFATATVSSSFMRSRLLQIRRRIAQPRQIRGPRPRVQFLQQTVVAPLGLQFRYSAIGIVQIAEDDRFGRTHLLARGYDLSVLDCAVLLFGLDLHCIDPLYVVGA